VKIKQGEDLMRENDNNMGQNILPATAVTAIGLALFLKGEKPREIPKSQKTSEEVLEVRKKLLRKKSKGLTMTK
jgi:hypothetical protein